MGRKLQLKVIKADGSIEEYFHTKVLGAISHALEAAGQSDIYVAEQLADVVTYYLYSSERRHSVNSGEVLGVIKVALSSTGNETAAVALSEHHCRRQIRRSRFEVVSFDVCGLADAEKAYLGHEVTRSRWDKSVIARDLVEKYGLERQTARTVASIVEEKIFKMGGTIVAGSLVRQLVWGEAAALINAGRELEAV